MYEAVFLIKISFLLLNNIRNFIKDGTRNTFLEYIDFENLTLPDI
jgi:hypothetical protein